MYRLAVSIALAGLVLAACGGDDDPAAAPPTLAVPAEVTEPDDTAPAVTQSPSETAPLSTSATASSSDTSATATSAAPTTAAAPAGPVTISHVHGETVVDEMPERIVSLSLQWTDVLTALGTPPVAAAIDPYHADWYPWQEPRDVEQIRITADNAIPYEQIAALQPDLIVGSWAVADAASYDLLTAIAPTIPLLAERDVDPWQEMATAAGQFLGDPEVAAELIDAGDQVVADLVAELPGLAGKSYVMANYVPGDAIYVVADPNDGAAQLFAQLGMEIDRELLALEDGSAGRVTLSLERIGELDSDLLLLLTNGADPNDIPGYSALPAVQSGSVTVLEYADAVALNTPTPLSISYALDLVRPALDGAAE